MGAADIAGASDQIGSRGPRQRAERNLAPAFMSPRLAVSLRAASVRRGDKWVLRAVSWQIKPGERWVLLGENGAGKTQLLKLLSGDIWPTPTGTRTAMRCYLAGRRTVELLDAKPRIAYIGGERQDKYGRYGWDLRARDVVATGLHRTDLLLSPVTRTEAGEVAAMLRACGIARLAARKFLSLSYGEKRLVLLARALVQQPDWLLLDEVYNGLDGEYRRRIDAVLAAARAKGQSWIATAHRATDIPAGTRFLIELSGGRIRQTKRFSTADHARLRARAGSLCRALRAAVSDGCRARRRTAGCCCDSATSICMWATGPCCARLIGGCGKANIGPFSVRTAPANPVF